MFLFVRSREGLRSKEARQALPPRLLPVGDPPGRVCLSGDVLPGYL